LAGGGVIFLGGFVVASVLFALAAGLITAWEGRSLPAEPPQGVSHES